MGNLDPDDSRPPYLQVVGQLKRQIDAGKLKPGDKLPSHAELASSFGVGITTVKRALGDLQNDGLIVTRQGQGAFVRVTRGTRQLGRADAQLDDVRQQVLDLEKRVATLERMLKRR